MKFNYAIVFVIFLIFGDVALSSISDGVNYKPINVPDRSTFSDAQSNNLVTKHTFYAPSNSQTQEPRQETNTPQPPTKAPQSQSSINNNKRSDDNIGKRVQNNIQSPSSNFYTAPKPSMVTKTFSNDEDEVETKPVARTQSPKPQIQTSQTPAVRNQTPEPTNNYQTSPVTSNNSPVDTKPKSNQTPAFSKSN